MFALIGMGIVTAAIISGYLMEHGNLSVLFQPAELVIIFGAATGGFLVATPMKTVKFVISSVMRMLTHSSFAKQDYMDVLMLLNGVFYKIRQQGLKPALSELSQGIEKSSGHRPDYRHNPNGHDHHHRSA